MKNNLKLLALILISGIIYLTGCSHPSSVSSSISGVWVWTTERDINKVNHVVARDTTRTYPAGVWKTTLTSDGHFSSSVHDSTYESGTYTLADHGILFYSYYDSIISQDAHNLVIMHADTTTVPNFDEYIQVFSFTR